MIAKFDPRKAIIHFDVYFEEDNAREDLETLLREGDERQGLLPLLGAQIATIRGLKFLRIKNPNPVAIKLPTRRSVDIQDNCVLRAENEAVGNVMQRIGIERYTTWGHDESGSLSVSFSINSLQEYADVRRRIEDADVAFRERPDQENFELEAGPYFRASNWLVFPNGPNGDRLNVSRAIASSQGLEEIEED